MLIKWGNAMQNEVTATGLRNNIYKILDSVIETGEPVKITRRDRKIVVSLLGKPDKMLNPAR